MNRDAPTPRVNAGAYEAVLRVSEAISACRQPEELAKVLADELSPFLHFNLLDVIVFKENSQKVEWHAWGKGSPPPVSDLPIEEMPGWDVVNTQEPLHIADWNSDQRFSRLKQVAAAHGVRVATIVRLPLTTPHRRLGTLGIASEHPNQYSGEDIDFLRLIARVVAFAIDDGLNLRRAQAAQTELQRQNDRLRLLLDLTNRLTSTLELRELLRAIAANIREVMQGDVTGISLYDPASGKFRVYALNFPRGKGLVREDLLITPIGAGKRAFDTLQPVIVSTAELEQFPPEIQPELALVEGVHHQCLIPLINHGRALGLLVVGRTSENPYAPDDIEFLSQVAGQIAIAIENALAYQEISELRDKLAQEKLYLEEEIRSEMNFEQIVGNSTSLKHVLQLVETVAPNDSTVLLLGETGTRKELIARAIHDHSRRQGRTFVKLNCAAIPTGLLESELFGHEKGAFTGAIAQKIGRLELADKGTLFLDEVGDIPSEIQPKLLRALQEREFERLGSTHTKKVDVRLIAATNRDLEKMIEDKHFRSDLYYRLNVFPIRIPPLRDRREDIPLLVSYFVQKFAKQMQKKIESISPSVMKGLTIWDWPGNIRELENFIERAVILTRGRSLEAPLTELRKIKAEESHSVPLQTKRAVTGPGSSRTDGQGIAEEYANKQREEIVRVLAECKGRVGGADGAAARLGINRTTLLSRMKKLGIYAKQYA